MRLWSSRQAPYRQFCTRTPSTPAHTCTHLGFLHVVKSNILRCLPLLLDLYFVPFYCQILSHCGDEHHLSTRHRRALHSSRFLCDSCAPAWVGRVFASLRGTPWPGIKVAGQSCISLHRELPDGLPGGCAPSLVLRAHSASTQDSLGKLLVWLRLPCPRAARSADHSLAVE